VDEVAWCVCELGATDVAFYDDALLFDAARHILPILEGVISSNLAVRFHTPNGVHARFVDRILAATMRRAGFVSIRLGLETDDPQGSLRDPGKVDELGFAQAVQALFEAGYSADEVAAYTLIARPGQSLQRVRSIVALAQRLGVPVRTAQFSPVPGTAEFAAAVSAGCIAADADPLLHNNSIYPCADAEQWEELKHEIQEGNRALLA